MESRLSTVPILIIPAPTKIIRMSFGRVNCDLTRSLSQTCIRLRHLLPDCPLGFEGTLVLYPVLPSKSNSLALLAPGQWVLSTRFSRKRPDFVKPIFF